MGDQEVVTTQRKSSIELLKVIAMFLICASHVVNPILNLDGATNFSTDFHFILYTIVKNLGWMGDYIFIACSAYFLVGNKKLNIKKIIFYYVDVCVLFFCYYLVFFLFNVEGTSGLTTRTFTTRIFFDYWYIKTYLLFLILLPLVNFVIAKLPQKIHCVLCWCVLPISLLFLILSQLNLSVGFYDVFLFINMLIIMDYGKRYGKFLFLREDNQKGVWISLILSLSYFIIADIVGNFIGVNCNFFIKNARSICDLFCPVWYIVGISLFLIFKNANIKQSKFVNYISSLSLIFYLAHHNKFTSLVFETPLYNAVTANPSRGGIILFVAVLLRFIYGIIVSVVYKETIHRLIKFIIDKIKINKRPKDA